MSTHAFVICDVFSEAPLEGNQLGVFTDGGAVCDERMLALARELDFSESTFVLPASGEADARVRIFTPAHEIPFAGRPTLGTAWVLAEERGLETVSLETGSGVVPVVFERVGGKLTFGRMRQPVPVAMPFEHTAELLAGLGVAASELPVELYDNGIRHVFVALPSEAEVAALRPDMGRLEGLGEITISCFAGAGQRWKTRVFVPALGVAEDPATGSAAGPLALHLARHQAVAWGEEIQIRQGAEVGRPSKLHARVDGDATRVDRVEVGGCAVVVARGAFALP